MCQNNDPELCPLSYIKLRNLKLNFEEPKITKKMEKKPILRLQDLVSSNGFKTTPSPVFKVNYLKIECKGCQYEYPNGSIKVPKAMSLTSGVWRQTSGRFTNGGE